VNAMTAAVGAHDLSIAYRSRGGSARQVVADVELALQPRRIVGLAGESGCGKSTLALALAGYRAPGAEVIAGAVELGEETLSGAPIRRLRKIWGARVAYMPQDTSTALNPALRIGRQITEPLRAHEQLSRAAATARATELLERVGIPEPAQAMRRYPHQFSGGQQQRIALAIGLVCDPEVLILDEPTTGLDVTTQARVNELILALARERGMATLYVSHNLTLLATICDDLAIMYAGEIVERGPAREVFLAPRHPYTAALIAAVPAIGAAAPPHGIPGRPPAAVVPGACGFAARCRFAQEPCMTSLSLVQIAPGREVRCARAADLDVAVGAAAPTTRRVRAGGAAPLIEAREVACVFRHRGHETVALGGVSVELAAGATLGIAGESGSGKSTLLRVLAGLLAPTGGELRYRGERLARLASGRPRETRRTIQMVFQNPDATLNPRHTILQSLERPLQLFRPDASGAQRREIAGTMLERVGLGPDYLGRFPRHLSGGQRQRVALARALVAEPDVLLCDEVTSALDVSVQASVIELLAELREERGLALVFVTHDLGVLSAVADEIVVLERGAVRESGPADEVLQRPTHPYTVDLIASLPDPRQLVPTVSGSGSETSAP
jgi:peptide/nickel transport system ATP-binding protein